jgi:hypothetical protein
MSELFVCHIEISYAMRGILENSQTMSRDSGLIVINALYKIRMGYIQNCPHVNLMHGHVTLLTNDVSMILKGHGLMASMQTHFNMYKHQYINKVANIFLSFFSSQLCILISN